MNVTKHLQYRQYLLSQEPFLSLNSCHSCKNTNKQKKAQLGGFNILNKFRSAYKKKERKKIKTKCQEGNK